MQSLKTCNTCGDLTSDFRVRSYYKDRVYLDTSCRLCENKRRGLYRPTPQQQKEYTIKHYYGVELHEVPELCEICGGTNNDGRRLFVDHDKACCSSYPTCHRCVRGFLCKDCNLLLGYAKDNIEILDKAIGYLELRKK